MTEAAPRRWTIEEFFAWQEKQNVHDDIDRSRFA
jgi:hypothetical protein